MTSYIEYLLRSSNLIKFGWKREPGAVTYKIYVSRAPAVSTLVLLTSGIPDMPCKDPTGLGKIVQDVTIEDVRTALSLADTFSFLNTQFYFAITYVNSSSAESSLNDSTIVEVPPVGISTRYMKDDFSVTRHPYLYSDEALKWVKSVGSYKGATIIDSADYYKTNLTIDYTYDGTNVKTMRSYLSDATTSGSPAKLTTYDYTGNLLIKVQITDSTVL